MATDKKIICPIMGDVCIEDGAIVKNEFVACRFWTKVHGKHPQTGEQVDAADCAIVWLPMLLIENSKEQRTTAAEVEKLRNEVVPQTNSTNSILAQIYGRSVQPDIVPIASGIVQPHILEASNGADHIS